MERLDRLCFFLPSFHPLSAVFTVSLMRSLKHHFHLRLPYLCDFHNLSTRSYDHGHGEVEDNKDWEQGTRKPRCVKRQGRWKAIRDKIQSLISIEQRRLCSNGGRLRFSRSVTMTPPTLLRTVSAAATVLCEHSTIHHHRKDLSMLIDHLSSAIREQDSAGGDCYSIAMVSNWTWIWTLNRKIANAATTLFTVGA